MALIPAGSVEISGSSAPAKFDSFCLDHTEVTVADFSKCVDDHKCTAPLAFRDIRFADDAFCNYKHPAGRQLHPINCVSFEQATKFCASAGKRLPTESEWQWAAQGGSEKRIFPWGDARPSPQNVNACGLECVANAAQRGFTDWPALYRVRDDYPETAPVGVIAGGASAFKTFDMAGNVREWTSTETSPSEKGAKRFISRGGSWQEDTADALKTSHRFEDEASSQYPSLGFRCAK
jgi:formylglycine-generating enzyme required for sulfatase activity